MAGIASVGAVPFLSSCEKANGGHIYTVRATAFATWGSKVVQGSTLIQAAVLGGGNRPTLGQAIVLELAPSKKLYVLSVTKEYTSTYGDYYRGAITNGFAYGLTSPASLIRPKPARENTDEKAKYLHGLPTGSKATHVPNSKPLGQSNRSPRPAIVGFENDLDPRTGYLVSTIKPASAYGRSFKLDRFEFERLPNDTGLEVTLDAHLPWVKQDNPIWFERSPDYLGPDMPSDLRLMSDPRLQEINLVQRSHLLYIPGRDF